MSDFPPLGGGKSHNRVYKLSGCTLDAKCSQLLLQPPWRPIRLSGDTTTANKALAADANLDTLASISGTQPRGEGLPQEMWIISPKGGAAIIYLMLAGSTCFIAMFLTSRNRLANTEPRK
jgi:hypothetical protein